ncbi:beta-galactosidase [Paenibacillus castaneae]|uniref:beta-galactosidase n=1 Tax=Paenibacillus castaneae TaxID=474957 RepID=UPI000C99F2AF|nr:beta-galactosidase [Paenibacillus castaneae]NIK78071.1 beta-galactosidase [Paenibacillus castaneae]
MKEPVLLGSQLYINKDDTPNYVRQMVRSMKENGLDIIRLFMVWEQLEPTEGEWQFDNYDACFDEALSLGLSVVPTLMSVSPPGWMRLTQGPQSVADLDDPAYQKRMKIYIERIVTKYKDYKNLDSWILWNEASRSISMGQHAMRAYADYVRKKYKKIETYNLMTYQQYRSFDELAEETQSSGVVNDLPFKSYAEQLEWMRFSVHNLNQNLIFIRDEIRKYDSIHPVQVNPHNLQGDMQSMGQSIWEESKIVDFLGCSAHPVWHSLRFPLSRWTQSVGFFADLMKSATQHPERKFWVTELQGGASIFSAGQTYTPSKETLQSWMWESIGSGAKAVVFWCFNSRNSGYEAGEWSLLNQLEQPSPRLAAVKEVAETLRKNEKLFSLAHPECGKVVILYSEPSWALGQLEGDGHDLLNPRNKNMYADAMAGSYLMFSDLSITAEFINDRRLEQEGIPAGAQILILPNSIVLTESMLVEVEKFARHGGTVIADGLTAMKGENGNMNRTVWRQSGELFGSIVQDIEIDREKLRITLEQNDTLEGWYYRLPLQADESATVLGTFFDGRPAITERRIGEGKMIRIGTSFFQHYFAKPQSNLLSFLRNLVGRHLFEEVKLINSSSQLRLRVLGHPQGKILILINEGDMAEAQFSFNVPGQLIPLNRVESSRTLQCGDLISKEIPEHSVSIWFYRTD